MRIVAPERRKTCTTNSSGTSKVKVFFRLPGRMKREFNAQVLSDGYGPRGKSRWVREALEAFLAEAHWLDLLEAQLIVYDGGESRDHVSLSSRDLQRLRDAERGIKANFEHLEGTRSKLIRAAITTRLLNLASTSS